MRSSATSTRYANGVSRREQWRKVLDSEVRRWSDMSSGQLASELRDERNYEVDVDSKEHQVDVPLLENTEGYLDVIVDLHDGSLRGFIHPLSQSFILKKAKSTATGDTV
jgi:hypothetical protein